MSERELAQKRTLLNVEVETQKFRLFSLLYWKFEVQTLNVVCILFHSTNGF